MWVKSGFLYVKIHQYVKSASKSKHPVTITIKKSIQIHHSIFGGKKWMAADWHLRLHAKASQIFWKIWHWYDGRCKMSLGKIFVGIGWWLIEVRWVINVCCYFRGGTSLHRFILEMPRFWWDSIFFIVEMIKCTWNNEESKQNVDLFIPTVGLPKVDKW